MKIKLVKLKFVKIKLCENQIS